jgi:hypothetical protein
MFELGRLVRIQIIRGEHWQVAVAEGVMSVGGGGGRRVRDKQHV